MKKYYIIKRNSPQLFRDYLGDISQPAREQVLKRRQPVNPGLLLIEKTIVKDGIGTSEHYTNLWEVNEGVDENWQKYVKGRMLYDYTGIISPLIHLKGEVMTFDQYANRQKVVHP